MKALANGDILIQSSTFTLTLGANGLAKSLLVSGEECLDLRDPTAFFAVTQPRPFNNEVKLAHPNKRTTFEANHLRVEDGKLIVGFEITPYEAVVEVVETPLYVGFTLADFIVHPTDYPRLRMSPPPVEAFRLVQLPVKNREHFGAWLNVSWDEQVAVNVLATSPHACIDSEKRNGYRVFTAEAQRGIKLRGCGAALIAAPTARLMDAIEAVETDFDLPKGVASRRSDLINASCLFISDLTPQNVDAYIAYAKKGGFRVVLITYRAFTYNVPDMTFGSCGDFDFNEHYPNGYDDVRYVVNRIRAAGILPGFHFLHTHVGIKTRYIAPVADHRLNLTRVFTLSRPLGLDDTTVYVEQNPEDCVMDEKCRILQFQGELIHYDGYSTEVPYCFTGCARGYYATTIRTHERGERGGLLDVSEFTATSCYLDQNSDLQEEIGAKIAALYNCGFGFAYFDGSEGTNEPFAYHIPNAQHRVYRLFDPPPAYCEGAAKAHFSWHMLSGGNAFDIFPMNIFKEKIIEHPFEEAPRMRCDFTRLNFGWWNYNLETQSDIFEFGTSRAAAWDCPASIQIDLSSLRGNARTDDILEVMRRWEDVRARNLLTDADKEALKNPNQEHTLLIDENKAYRLTPCDRLDAPADITAYTFLHNDKRYVSFWHNQSSAEIKLPVGDGQCILRRELYEEGQQLTAQDGCIILHAENKMYLETDLSLQAIQNAFQTAELLEGVSHS